MFTELEERISPRLPAAGNRKSSGLQRRHEDMLDIDACTPRRVLVVEDDERIGVNLARSLHAEGYDVEPVDRYPAGDVVVDLAQRRVFVGGSEVALRVLAVSLDGEFPIEAPDRNRRAKGLNSKVPCCARLPLMIKRI